MDDTKPKTGRSKKAGLIFALAMAAAGAVYLFSGNSGGDKERPPTLISADLTEVAQTAARVLKIMPGARVLAVEPLFAEAWKAEHAPLAGTLEEIEKQLEPGRVTFVVVDDLTTRRSRPGLKPLITADRVGEAGLVYRKYLSDKNRLVSIYRLGAPSFKVEIGPVTADKPESVKALLQEGRRYYDAGNVEHARQVYEELTRIDPQNPLPRRELVKVYMIYGYFDGGSLERAQDELFRYSLLAEDGGDAKRYTEAIESLRVQHKALWGTE